MSEKPPRELRGGASKHGGAWWREEEKPPRFNLPPAIKKLLEPKPKKPPKPKEKKPPKEAKVKEPKLPRPPKLRRQSGRRLVVTADDFGASVAVNAAVEQAHKQGILTAASLMVAGDAAADAVARAKVMPGLGVGLHIVLVEGRPVLAPDLIPDLVDSEGCFRTDMAWLGAEIFFRPLVRAQLYDEIEAQFEAFAATGLALDHVNAHKHFHLHPTIAGLILEIGAHFGLSAARAPIEPLAILNAIEPTKATPISRLSAHYARSVAQRFRDAWVVVPDQVFGIAWSGALTRDRLAGLIAALPEGLSEIYAHPATGDYVGSAPGYLYADELAALTDPAIRNETAARGITLGNFADFTRKETA